MLTRSRPTGGASVTAPASWNDNDLSVYFTRTASFASRAATRLFPTNTAGSSPSSNKINIGAIAGGAVGGLVALIAILCLILFCLHRRKKAIKKHSIGPAAPASPPPAELATTISRQEMPAPGTGKYLSMHHSSDSNAYSSYSGGTSQPSRPASYNHNSPHSFHSIQPHISTSPASARSYPADATQQVHHQYNTYSPDHDNRMSYDNHSPSWDQHIHPAQPAITLQHQYPYPAPASPAIPPSYQAQQQPQVYFPPPPESAGYPHRSQPSVDYLDNPDATRYSTDAGRGPLSTTTTPAQFYAQPVPVRLPVMGEDMQRTPVRYEEDGVRGSEEMVRQGQGQARERTRPARGRFVEVDHM